MWTAEYYTPPLKVCTGALCTQTRANTAVHVSTVFLCWHGTKEDDDAMYGSAVAVGHARPRQPKPTGIILNQFCLRLTVVRPQNFTPIASAATMH